MRTTTEVITPEVASTMLKTIGTQRPLNRSWVRELSRRMKDGVWQFTGDPVRFNTKRELIDGQHRLHAIVDSGVAQQCLVIRGLDPASFSAMDQGKKRTSADALRIVGAKNAKTIGSAIKKLVSMKYGAAISNTRSMDNEEARAFYEANREVLEHAAELANRTRLIPESIGATAYFFYLHINPAMADLFVEKVATGAGLDERSPILALRNKLTKMLSDKSRNRTETHIMLPILNAAWNAFVAGREATKNYPAGDYPADIELDDNGYPKAFWDDK